MSSPVDSAQDHAGKVLTTLVTIEAYTVLTLTQLEPGRLLGNQGSNAIPIIDAVVQTRPLVVVLTATIALLLGYFAFALHHHGAMFLRS